MNHLGGAYPGGDTHTFWPDIWGYLLIEYDIRSMVDIGCGYGHNAKWFLEQGCQVIGVEGDEEAIKGNVLPHDSIIVHDYTLGPLAGPNVDLAMALEFVEHVDQKFECNWIETTLNAKWLLICHAVPGQGGHHHVNEQTSEYWEQRLALDGWEYYKGISDAFRATTKRKPSPWGRQTAMFFGRMDD